MQDGPQHHGSGVGVVAKELPRSLGQEHSGDHPEHHQGVCQTNDDQYLGGTKRRTIVFASHRRHESDRPEESENATHHGGDADQHQRAAQVGVLVLFRLAVDVVDDL